jgi:hypothetical protein
METQAYATMEPLSWLLRHHPDSGVPFDIEITVVRTLDGVAELRGFVFTADFSHAIWNTICHRLRAEGFHAVRYVRQQDGGQKVVTQSLVTRAAAVRWRMAKGG